MVVFPDDSGPKISLMRPRGNPPTPNAKSTEMDPVEIEETGTIASFDPSRRMDPFPNCFSIWPSAAVSTRARSLSSMDDPSGLLQVGINHHYSGQHLTG